MSVGFAVRRIRVPWHNAKREEPVRFLLPRPGYTAAVQQGCELEQRTRRKPRIDQVLLGPPGTGGFFRRYGELDERIGG